MSELEQLLNEFCPYGVEYAKLAKVCYIASGKDHKKLEDGKFPVYGSGGIMRYVDSFLYNKPSVLIPRKGSISNLFYVEQPFWVVDTIFYTEIDEIQIVPKFLYYVLSKMHLEELNSAGGVPSLTKAVLDCVSIPLPPLPVQEEIVRILDKFTALEAELEAELEARKKQFFYYRETLLTSSDDVEWETIGEVCDINRGRVISKEYLRANAGMYPVYSSQTENQGVFGYINSFDYDFESITWTTDGANAGSVFYHNNERFSITNVCGLLRTNTEFIIPKYLFYFLGMQASMYVNAGMGNPKLMSNSMSRIPLALPDLETQARIVSILDRFDALVNDITQGLPAELAARRKQYEYYRDKLLTFKEKVS